MHVNSLAINNIRCLQNFKLSLKTNELPGWHVLLGDNGTGKSTAVRALALALMGKENALALRGNWLRWLSDGSATGKISTSLQRDDVDKWTGKGQPGSKSISATVDVRSKANRGKQNGGQAEIEFSTSLRLNTIWGGGAGWFSASFGPFRRFTGSDKEMDMLYLTHPRLAPHLSAFGENVALGECLRWLKQLRMKTLEKDAEAREILDAVLHFINQADLLPHGASIKEVTSERVVIVDGGGAPVDVEEMSDGYRSILSLTFELMRLMFLTFDTETALQAIDAETGTIRLPGVVAIDEIDVHLHPAWQQRIGEWFVQRFPETQFFVTTHSPIICRAARRGSVWLLPQPGSDEKLRRITGDELARLIDGNILDAYGTELFGERVTRSAAGEQKLDRLARLNRKCLTQTLSAAEQRERDQLRAAMSSNPSITEGD